MKLFRRTIWFALTGSLLLAACAPATASPQAELVTREAPSLTAMPLSPATPETDTPTPTTEVPTGTAAAGAALDPTQLKSNLDTWVPAAIQAGGGSACSIAVVYPDPSGKLVSGFYNYGTLAKDSSTQVDSTTVYEIGSLTKLFAADVLANLVIRGQVTLRDPIKNYLPSDAWVPSFNAQTIELGQLATQTSGLPLDFEPPTGPKTVNGEPVLNYVTDAMVLRDLATYQLMRTPGRGWENSNAAYAVLGLIEERLGNTSFDKLVQNQVNASLGLSDTAALLTSEQETRLAQGYAADGKKGIAFAPVGAMVPSAGLRSTAKDLAAYLAANLEPSKDGLGSALQLTQQAEDIGPNATSAMGLGWIIGQAGTPQAAYYKSGATDGYSAYIAFWPATKTGFVLLCNGQAAKDLAPKISQALGGAGTPVDTSD